MMMGVFFLFFAVLSASALENEDLQQGSQILLNLATNFTSSYNDFTDARPNSDYFPLAKSKEENEKLNRINYTEVNDEEHAKNITEKLRTWRGFEDFDSAMSVTDLLLETYSDISNDLQASILAAKITMIDLQKLPFSWQYLLPHQFYDNLGVTGADYAELVNSNPGNTALLYKIAVVLRDEPVAVKDDFVSNLNLPNHLREELGYIIGYRWDLDAQDSNDKFTMSTLLHLPIDVIFGMNETSFEALNLPEKLTDMSNWNLASLQSKVAWYTKFGKHRGWEEVVGTPHHVKMHGHLLSGAPLEKLRDLKKQTMVDPSLLADVLVRTDMDPLRVQEVWEALTLQNKRDAFVSLADKLDVSQMIEQYRPEQNQLLEDVWLSQEELSLPWVNLLSVGFSLMEQEEFDKWTMKEMLDLGKFVAILSPSELNLIPATVYTSSVLPKIMSPVLSLSQLTSVYNKYLEIHSTEVASIHPILLSALPSESLMSSSAPFIWSQDKSSLLAASAKFSPGQMYSLHEITKVGHWAASNLTTILSIHPQCMSDVHPWELRSNIDQVVSAVYNAGPPGFHTIASKIQSLPRHLLMAWLEKVYSASGSKRLGDWWNSNVLLDRFLPTNTLNESITNPFPNHPLATQFNSFISTNRSLLPSMALSGMSCHCIDLVETPDALEVLSLYRYYIENEGVLNAIPSSARKCWAKKVRQFLYMKAVLFNVTVTSEPELLSLLTTSDVRSIGGEVLLTWGGSALASITHPEVMHEVLMTVAHTSPSHFMRNGVKYGCMVTMATTLLDTMIREEGKVNLAALTHTHNLVPYTDYRIMEASAEDIKIYVSTVLRPVCKAVCLKKKERELLRQLILKGYGSPSTWNPMDLVELGDLLVVMDRSDLASVDPSSLRMAAAQLSSGTFFTSVLSEIRGESRPVIYHEACSAWLGGKEGRESQEAVQMYNQWNMLGQFIVIGNFLQVEVLKNGMTIPKPRMSPGFRRKRQAGIVDDADIDYKAIYSAVMQDMKSKFDAKELTDNQKMEATRIITETQKMLGDTSFAVLGIERGDKTQAEVLAVLAEYKDAGNMTEEQNILVQRLAVDTQVRMIQELVEVLGLTFTDLGITEDQMSFIQTRETFNLAEVTAELAEATTETSIKELLPTQTPGLSTPIPTVPEIFVETTQLPEVPDILVENTPLPDVSTLVSMADETTKLFNEAESTVLTQLDAEDTTAPLQADVGESVTAAGFSESNKEVAVTLSPVPASSSTTSSTTSVSPLSTTTYSNADLEKSLNIEDVENELDSFLSNSNLTDYIIFRAYEPNTDYFTKIPALESVMLSCDVIIAAGSSASAISASDIAKMTGKEAMNCLEIVGRIPWSQAKTESIWKGLKSKVLQGSGSIKRQEMFQLMNLLPAIATHDAVLLDMDRKNIDGISFLGRLMKSSDTEVLKLLQRYISSNGITATNPLTGTEAASLGQLLCGLTDDQTDLLTSDVFSGILTEHLSQLDCPVSAIFSLHLSTMLVDLYGTPGLWTTSDLLSIGWVASNLSPDQLSQIQDHAMEGLTGLAVKYLSREQIGSLSHHQLSRLSPHAASFISKDQLMPFTNIHRRRGIRAAVGEDETKEIMMKEIEPEMQVEDEKRNPKDIGAGNGVVGTNISGLNVLITALVFMAIFGM